MKSFKLCVGFASWEGGEEEGLPEIGWVVVVVQDQAQDRSERGGVTSDYSPRHGV